MSRWPYAVICVTTVIGALLAVAFFSILDVERDNDDLFTPTDASSFDDYRYMNELYGSYTGRVRTRQSYSKTVKLGRVQSRILAVRHPNERAGDSCEERLLLSDEESARKNIQAWFQVYEEIRVMEVEYDGELYSLDDICFRASEDSPCLVRTVYLLKTSSTCSSAFPGDKYSRSVELQCNNH